MIRELSSKFDIVNLFIICYELYDLNYYLLFEHFTYLY